MYLKRVNNEVAIANEKVVKAGRSEIETLKEFVRISSLGRSRICAHTDSSDPLHEMIIALAKTTYIRPHKHYDKSESFHIIEGELDVILFDEAGHISDVIPMGLHETGRIFYYRLSEPLFHTLLIRTDLVIVHETTNGPFKKDDAVFAPWSPQETDLERAQEFMRLMAEAVEQYRNTSSTAPPKP
jgi:cupin fold WbuC family metalloprotein